MEGIVNKIVCCEYNEIPFEDFPINEKFGLIITKNSVKFEFLININSSSNKLIVLGSGAVNEWQLKKFENRPKFDRHSWYFDESTIFYNDPTRYIDNSLEGGWGIGTPNEWYLETIKNIILSISKYFNYKNENLLFYGSSLGGFMSIMLSTLIKGSKSLADVPQLTFENTNYWRRIKNIIFPNYSDEQIKKDFNYRLNVLYLMEKEKYIPNLTMIFDAGHVDISEHYVHFFEELNRLTNCYNKNRIKILINPIDEHKFLNKNETLQLINEVLNDEKSNIDSSYSDLFDKNQVLQKQFSKLLMDENIIVIENIVFNIPKNYHVISYNPNLCSYEAITNGDSTLYFVLESKNGNSCKNLVNVYFNYLKRENGTPVYETFTFGNQITVHKVKNLSSKTVRYWFKCGKVIIQIFSYFADAFIDKNVEYIVKNMRQMGQ